MTRASIGDKVRLHYVGKLEDGHVFDTSHGRSPFEFTLGNEKVIPGLTRAVHGMAKGEKKTVTIPLEEAHGPWNKELVVEIQKNDLPDEIEPEVGKQVEIMRKNGELTRVTITDIAEDTVTIDSNHPLAGKALVMELELVDID
jgi:FKBP-type peptidyl-prolyl cis-trans isomerase 2